jgi:hypothetical protein
MATTEIIILDRDKAYTIDETDPTNVLTASGFHLVEPNVRRKLEDYDSTPETGYTMEVVTDADEILALKFLDDMGGFAVFPVYSGTEAEVFEGYLAIKDADGAVCSLDGGIYLGTATIEKSAFITAVIAYLSDPVKQAEFLAAEDPPTAVTDAVTTAKGKVRFAE